MKNSNKSKIKDFTDLEAWVVNHESSLLVYKLTKAFPGDEKFGLTTQLRRAASSVTANIAEGFGRYHYKDKIKFYYNARGSVYEVRSFLILAKDLGYIRDTEIYNETIRKVFQGAKVLNGLIRSTEQQS